MRPERLQLRGFTAFREPTEVDFAGSELFALVGPTGAGKSSLVDAITFSLYGTVPRLDRRMVEPVVSLGALEARVRFDFTVAGKPYTVVRVVRRTKTGATTPEARLEGGAEIVAGADQVTEAVERLLGLSFDHFTKCVVLPQGEFAAFLHDKPAERQRLLRKLLDLDVYARMRGLATDRQSTAEAEGRRITLQLGELEGATADAEKLARATVDALGELNRWVATELPEIEEMAVEAASLRQAAAGWRKILDRLDAVVVPDGVADLSQAVGEAEDALSTAEAELDRAREEVVEAERHLALLPAATEVERLVDLHSEHTEVQERQDRGLAVVTEAEQAVAATARSVAGAAVRLAAARSRLEASERSHQAHLLAGGLEVGRPCPVCRQEVALLPPLEVPADLETARAELAAAEDERRTAEQAAERATRHLDVCRVRIDEVTDRLTRLASQLGDRTKDEIEAQRTLVNEAIERHRAARAAERGATAAVDGARRRLSAIGEQAERAWEVFDRARDGVAELGPPAAIRRRVADDWEALAAWAGDLAAQTEKEAAEAERAAATAEEELAERSRQIADRFSGLGLDPEVGDPRAVAAAALASAEATLATIREQRVRAARLAEELTGLNQSAEVAKVLARHLSATGFEAWLLEEALVALVAGANHVLADLSSGAYSLRVEKRDFVVVDHRNAEEVRPVRTLSGGETFLVSLALALTLSEELAAMSVHGAARLESIFLDEGFGTLDAETLDVVASVIHELGSRGRTVGLITHVAELAEQMPVRFEVRKGPRTSAVERVEG